MTTVISDKELNEMPEDARNRIIETRGKYGDNKWWECEDLRVVAYYQLNEPILITHSFEEFHEGVEKLLGHPVWTHEFGCSLQILKEEAEIKYKEVMLESPP